MEKEYAVWGYPKDTDTADAFNEALLLTHLRSMEEARYKMQVLREVHGCRKMRIQVIDWTVPDFAACVAV